MALVAEAIAEETVVEASIMLLDDPDEPHELPLQPPDEPHPLLPQPLDEPHPLLPQPDIALVAAAMYEEAVVDAAIIVLAGIAADMVHMFLHEFRQADREVS